MNTSLFITLFVFHHIADFLLQTYWQSQDKDKKILALLSHSFIYSLTLSSAVYLLKFSKASNILSIFIILFFSHLILDNQKFVFWFVKKVKGLKSEDKDFDLISLLVDQSFHFFILFLITLNF